MLGFLIGSVILVAVSVYWHNQKKQHEARVEAIPIRIHVNGTRGKSTVTRLIAGVLREGGYRTVAKTTGSAARVIHQDGSESPIKRAGPPTILEQMDIIAKHATSETDAIVMECMAVNPLYQDVSQHQIVNANITIITNVREDHQEVMGNTLPEIADALSKTIPVEGLLITTEDQPALQEQLADNAAANGSRFIYADPTWVTDEDLQAFDYIAFKENIAIGLSVAQELGIPRDVALRGMQRAVPDVGAVSVERFKVNGKELVWAPLFAVNDRESTILGVEALKTYHQPGATRIGVLNNRYDRAMRALKFAEIAAVDLKLDYYVTFGAYEAQVAANMVALGYPKERIIHLGDSQKTSAKEVLRQVLRLIEGEQGVLIGMVNVHTTQAELLVELFQRLRTQHTASDELLARTDTVPATTQRRHALTRRRYSAQEKIRV